MKFIKKNLAFLCSEPQACVNLDSGLGIPTHYDKRYRINIALKNRDVEDFIKKGRLAGDTF